MRESAFAFALLCGTLAAGQTTTLSSTPASATFLRYLGCPGAPVYASFALTSSSGAVPISVAIPNVTGPNSETFALYLDHATTPATLSIVGNSVLFPIPGTTIANIAVSSPGQPDLLIHLLVTFFASPPVTILGASTFSIVKGSPSGNIQSETVPILTSGCPGTHDFSVTTSPAGAWLSASASTLRTASGQGSADLTVTVNASNLAPGTYSGEASVDNTAGRSVFLTVYNSQLTAAPSALTFNASSTTPQTVQISGATGPFTVSLDQGANNVSCGTWLTASTASVTPVTVSYDPTVLPSGTFTCNGTVTITPSDSTVAPVKVPVRLNVGGVPTITAAPASPAFTITKGSPVAVTTAPVAVSSFPGVPYTATAAVDSPVGGNWLTASPVNGNTNGLVGIGIRPGASSLPVGTYTGSVTVSSNGSLGSPISIPVTLTVNAAPTLSVSPSTLAFSHQINFTTPAVQTLNVVASNGTSLATPTTFTVTTLTLTGSTPGSLLKILTPAAVTTGTSAAVPVSISYDAAVANMLAPGTYGGTIRVQPIEGVTTAPVAMDIPWALVIGGPGLPVATPSSLSFTQSFGTSTVLSQNLSITGPGLSATSYSMTYSSIGNWLAATPANGVTPGVVTVTANPAPGGTPLPAGTYTGTITLTVTNVVTNPSITVPVSFSITGSGTITVTPTSISASGNSLSVIAFNSLNPVAYTASAFATVPGWLSVTPASGTTATTALVTINTATLQSGATYTGLVQFNFANNSSVSVPVTVTPTLLGPCSLTASPSPVTLGANGTAPNGLYPSATQSITVTPSAGCPTGVQWTATTSAPWIKITASGGTSLTFTALSNTQTTSRTGTIALMPAGALFSNPLTVTESASTESATTRQVRALYQSILGREPDTSGFNFWTGVGQSGLGQMGNSFLTSPENIDTGVQTLAIYKAVLGRMPTAAEFLANSLHTGGAVAADQLLNQLLNSSEYASKYGSSATLTTYVTAIFNNLLGRAPTTQELNLFLGQPGFPPTLSPYGGFANLFQSDEFRNLGAGNRTTDHSNDLYVTLLYLEVLGRDPDSGGYAFWLAIANAGGPGVLFQSGPNVIRNLIMGPGAPGTGFIGSAEFQGRF